MGFSYHDNLIKFDAGPHRQFMSGNFTVDTFAISSGQDPNHVNAVGDVHVLDVSQDEPTLNFRAGRHKTDAIAQFWNQYIRGDATTANDQPDQLNFAFTGTLALQLYYPAKTVYLKDMAIGQGSYEDHSGILGIPDGTVTNWWFGGKACYHEAADIVHCQGVDENGAPMSVDLQHSERAETTGSHDPNVVHLVGLNYVGSNGFRPRRNAPEAI